MDFLTTTGILFLVVLNKVALVTSAPTDNIDSNSINNSSLVCSECFHVTFSSKDAGARVPEDTINRACLKEGKDYTHPDFLVCEPGVSYCRKLVGTARMMYKGYEIIAEINSRECGAEGNDTICRNDDFYIPKIFGQKEATDIRAEAQACFCDTNMCNRGDKVKNLTPVYVTLTLLVFTKWWL